MTFEELIIQRFDADVPAMPIPPQVAEMRRAIIRSPAPWPT